MSVKAPINWQILRVLVMCYLLSSMSRNRLSLQRPNAAFQPRRLIIAPAAVGCKRRLAGWLAKLNDISLRIKAIAYFESLKEPLFVG